MMMMMTTMNKRRLVQALLLVWASLVTRGESKEADTCSFNEESAVDPNLHAFEFDVGDGPQNTLIYLEPDIQTFYPEEADPEMRKKWPFSTASTGKFCNLSNQTVALYWQSRTSGQRTLQRYLAPWEASALGTLEGHIFVFTTVDDANEILTTMRVKQYPEAYYAYNPYQILTNPNPPPFLAAAEQELYTHWRQTLLFHKAYVKKTKKAYLANYLRSPASHFMWPAAFFGQAHWVVTSETHFVDTPTTLDKLPPTEYARRLQHNTTVPLSEYRDSSLNLTLQVVSVAPRVLEISNFLSATEIQHLLDQGDALQREDSPILDAIYRRAADVWRVDEALLRPREPDERPDVPGQFPLTEALRIMTFGPGQQYMEHADFNLDRLTDPSQPGRFATLILYLQHAQRGGQTTLPRASNAYSGKALEFTPAVGNAFLVYNQLPDGNFDDSAMYGMTTVAEGELVLGFFYLWDPFLVV